LSIYEQLSKLSILNPILQFSLSQPKLPFLTWDQVLKLPRPKSKFLVF